MKKFKLGTKLRCTITGFEGTAIAKCEYLNGCIQYCVKPKVKADGKFPEGQYIDQDQLEKAIETKKVKFKKNNTAGPQQNTPSDNYSG